MRLLRRLGGRHCLYLGRRGRTFVAVVPFGAALAAGHFVAFQMEEEAHLPPNVPVDEEREPRVTEAVGIPGNWHHIDLQELRNVPAIHLADTDCSLKVAI